MSLAGFTLVLLINLFSLPVTAGTSPLCLHNHAGTLLHHFHHHSLPATLSTLLHSSWFPALSFTFVTDHVSVKFRHCIVSSVQLFQCNLETGSKEWNLDRETRWYVFPLNSPVLGEIWRKSLDLEANSMD